ncbi:class I SAM-dependent methyltransferase [Flexivirga caeni]|uniref:Class I SAM-dependent methyltransferase n=1 Tax=Flexivirga caeni TaxID=2294115 RepID=A0A3M9MGT2_9MICO|nr:class I SAM-dependent methyltransferase [Flexivirga caeni]RNI24762.1 class I SAM-dependent methyltransferase [Flexivirga caeni]
MAALRDYVQWLDRYDDPDSPLSWRLRKVQQWLHDELDARPGPVDVVSVCAGDGRDIIDVLRARDDADRVNVVLLEAHPDVADLARQRARVAGLDRVEVRTCDAALTSSYAGAVPADIVLLVGLLGNMSHEDVSTTIAATPQLCRPGARLIWSRGRDLDDINDRVRREFTAAGFTEQQYAASDQRTRPAIGLMQYDGTTVPLDQNRRLFTFFR